MPNRKHGELRGRRSTPKPGSTKRATAVKSKSNPTSKGSLKSVARRLNMDDDGEEEYDEEIEVENPEEGNPEINDEDHDERGDRGHDSGQGRNEGNKKKKRTRRSSKSRSHATEAMKKELHDLKEMYTDGNNSYSSHHV